MPTQNLDLEVNQNVQDNKLDPAVENALDVIQRNYSEKNTQDSKNRRIRDMLENSMLALDPRGNKRISAKTLQQAIWRTIGRTKPHDFTIHAQGAERNRERLVTDGVATIMDKGGYVAALRGKQGAFFNQYMYGNGLIHVGTNPNKKGVPIIFNSISNDNVYTDVFATGMRWVGWGREATKAVTIFSHSWADFVQMFPEMKNKAGAGKIPREVGGQPQELFRNEAGIGEENMHDIVEVAYAYDIANENYTAFAGAGCTKIFEFKKGDYPFTLDGEPYIPVLNFMCMPSASGFFDHGIGDLIYDLAILSQRLDNMQYAHINENVYPDVVVNVAQGEAASFFNKLKLANEMRAQGKRGYIIAERNPSDPNAEAVTMSPLLTQNLFNEYVATRDRLDRELRRLGISLDEAEFGQKVTATQVLAEEENANAFIKQTMEYNASEAKFAVDIAMNGIKKFVSKKNTFPLNLRTKIETPFGPAEVKGLTMGAIAEELKTRDYFTVINARSGAIPSNVLRSAQVSRGLAFAPPGTPAYAKLVTEFAAIHDLDITGEDFAAPVPQTGGASGAGEETAPPASATDRLTINPRAAEQAPIL